MPTIKDYKKQIFVLTDGQVDNTEQVIQLVANNSRRLGSRMFSLGIGNAVVSYPIYSQFLQSNFYSYFLIYSLMPSLLELQELAKEHVNVSWKTKDWKKKY
jgi:hypothetical protein